MALLGQAFREKDWYPVAYVLPKEKDELLAAMAAGGDSPLATAPALRTGPPRNAANATSDAFKTQNARTTSTPFEALSPGARTGLLPGY